MIKTKYHHNEALSTRDHLGTCIELVVSSMFLSDNHPSLDIINQTFKSLLEKRKSQYLRQPIRLSKDAQNVVKMLAYGWSFEDLMSFDSLKQPSQKVFTPPKEELLESGILIERDSCISFEDPFYQQWVKNFRYPVIGQKWDDEEDSQVFSIFNLV